MKIVVHFGGDRVKLILAFADEGVGVYMHVDKSSYRFFYLNLEFILFTHTLRFLKFCTYTIKWLGLEEYKLIMSGILVNLEHIRRTKKDNTK